jgi:predicted ATPase/transcriptional regulator with XRE-family HTH domain
MATSDAQATFLYKGEENSPQHFSEWIKRRRQELDLTQEQLAKRACCSVFAIRKIEMGERRPSRQLAGVLAQALEILPEDQANFIKAARGELSVARLASPARMPARDSQPAVNANTISGNLPRALTSFIGREPEISALGQLLRDPQCLLLTIVGPGGIGKTRLAIEAANQSKDLFPDGVWFIPLVTLNSPASIVPAIADAVNFRFQDPTDPQTQLLRYLCAKKLLLILDNAEHLLEGVGLLTEILNACPQVKLLVTSRERLNLLSEWVFEVQGLPVPASDQEEQFTSYSAVALLVQSARRVRAGFELREEDRSWVLKICQILEGMPLGIELAAAWVGLLSCEVIAKEIERNIDFLAVSMRDLPERHRSLRATLDHSWKLLNDEERLILSRLAVFHGNFSREAAQEICGGSLSVLSSLKNKGLLYRTEQDFYSLHEIIRQYAGLKLAEHPEEDERVKERHATYFVQRLSAWEKALQSSRQLETFNEMARVIDNLSQGWQYMVTHCHPKTGKRISFYADLLHSALFSISLFYEMRCRSLEAIALFKESIEYLKAVRAEFEGTEDCSHFNSVLGHITAYLGLHYFYIFQYEKSREYLNEAIQLLENSQSRVEKAQAQVMLASICAIQGQIQEPIALLQQSREVFREEGVKWWYALSIVHIAINYFNFGKLQECEALFQEGFQLVEPGDLRSELPLRDGFAYVLLIKGDYDRAEQLMRENLQLSYLFGNFRLTASILFNLGRVALATQRIELAEEYIQKSIHLLTEYGEARDLATYRLYLGKCFAARADFQEARNQFRLVIKIGQEMDKPHMMYWGLVSIARMYQEEGQVEKALEISLALRNFPIQYLRIKGEGDRLLADLQAELPQWQVDAIMKQVDSKVSPDPVGANALAYALEHVTQ